MKVTQLLMPALLPALLPVFAIRQATTTSTVKEAISYKANVFEPNFSSKMLSPVQDVVEVPRLYPAREAGTINVAIFDDGYYCNPALCEVVKDACDAWAEATKVIPEGGLHFNYRITKNPNGADIIFKFGCPEQCRGYEGFTTEYGSYALVKLSGESLAGEPVKLERMRRIATHEMGHALGIWGHSPNKEDMMSLDEETKTISVADVNTLRLAYRKTPLLTEQPGRLSRMQCGP